MDASIEPYTKIIYPIDILKPFLIFITIFESCPQLRSSHFIKRGQLKLHFESDFFDHIWTGPFD